MDRTLPFSSKLTKAISIALFITCPFSAGAAGTFLKQVPGEELSNSYFIQPNESALERWRSYALADIMPVFSWSIRPSNIQAPSILDRILSHEAHVSILSNLTSFAEPQFVLNLESTWVSDTPGLIIKGTRGTVMPHMNSGLERYRFSSGFTHRWGNEGVWSVSAVLAYQQFTSHGMGSLTYKEGYVPSGIVRADTGSFGTGTRIDIGNTVWNRMSWNAGFQTRINMDAFNNYRGVYSEPGDFDIPASADVNFNVIITPMLSMDFTAQRVMYSDITPFTSSSLPTRFLALLGDAISPVFAWHDLTVYSIGGVWQDPVKNKWSLRYSTREQPSPTSNLLLQALRPQFSNYSLEMGVQRTLGKNSDLHFIASYAPSEYGLGAPTNFDGYDKEGGNQLELEALLAYRF